MPPYCAGLVSRLMRCQCGAVYSGAVGKRRGGAMYQIANHRQQFEDAGRQIIEHALYVSNPDEDSLKRQRNYSQRRALAVDVVQAAMQHALATGQDVDQFSDLAGRGIGVIDSLAYSLKEHKTFDFRENVKREPEWHFWKHEDQPGALIKARKFPYMDRSNVEEAATTYLDLPYRAPFLERTIVDVLIALELYAYSKEMLEKPMPGFSLLTRSPLMQKHALRRYVSGQFWSAVVLLGLAYLAGMYGSRLFGETASTWIAGILVGLWVLDLVVSTVALPFAWHAQRKARKYTRDLMLAMAHTYRELSADGQVSTRRLREVAVRAADQGVVWPAPLFLILDDNIARIGRL
jgi:hypothetical protein